MSRRDAASLAKLHREGELTGGDAGDEAMRDLVRALSQARHVTATAG